MQKQDYGMLTPNAAGVLKYTLAALPTTLSNFTDTVTSMKQAATSLFAVLCLANFISRGCKTDILNVKVRKSVKENNQMSTITFDKKINSRQTN